MSRRQQILCVALVAAACGPRVLDADDSGSDGDVGGDTGAPEPDPDPDPEPEPPGETTEDPPPDVPDDLPELEICPLAPSVLRETEVDVGTPIIKGIAFVRVGAVANDALLVSVEDTTMIARDGAITDSFASFGADAFAVGDIEPDGDQDVVAIEANAYFRVYPQIQDDPGDPFAEVPAIEAPGATAIAFADFDGDGTREVFLAQADGVIARRTEGVTFGEPIPIDAPSPSLAVARDWTTEVDAVVYQIEQIYLVTAAGDGPISYRALPGSSPALPERRLYTSDLDGDVRDDVIAIDLDGSWTQTSVWWTGEGEWGPSRWRIGGELPYGAAADLDLDGREDLVLGGPGGLALVLGGDAEIAGDAVDPVACMTWLSSPIEVAALAIGDYDGDGFRDIAVTDGAAVVVLSLV